jgi:hypothetical protein
MSSEYFAHTLTALDDLAAVTSRTSAMIAAVNAHRDFKLIEVMRSAKVDELETVYLMVDVECHGVPTHNEYGLRFRERMLIHVPQDDAKATVVWSMRKDFPRLAHQNSVTSQGPAQLCLYFEPPPLSLAPGLLRHFLLGSSGGWRRMPRASCIWPISLWTCCSLSLGMNC